MVTHFCISSHYTHGMYVATAFVVFFAKCRIWCLVINQNEINLYYVQQFRHFVHTIFLYPCMVADLVLTLHLDVKKIPAKCRNYPEFPNSELFSHWYILLFMLYTIIISRFIMHSLCIDCMYIFLYLHLLDSYEHLVLGWWFSSYLTNAFFFLMKVITAMVVETTGILCNTQRILMHILEVTLLTVLGLLCLIT